MGITNITLVLCLLAFISAAAGLALKDLEAVAPAAPAPFLDCSSVVVKESEGVLNWLGNVTFAVPVDTTAAGWTMTLTFDQKYTGLGVWDVTTVNHGDQMYAEIFNKPENAVLTEGQKFSFRFRINYFTDVPQPKLVGARFQDLELCR